MNIKIIWMTDLHIVPEGNKLSGHDSAMRLRIAVDYIKKYHDDADFCIISGDLTDGGDAASYQLVDEIMSVCNVPVLFIPGNHDDRTIMREQLSFPENTDSEFIQYSIIKNGCRLLFLDSLQENSAEGFLCNRRLNWLESELSIHRDLPTMIFCHHPPGKLFLPIQDQDQKNYGDKLLDLLCAAPNVRHLFFGHVHRPVSGNFRGLSFTALQSTALQVPLPYPEWDWESFVPAEEAPAIGIVCVSTDSVVVHFHAFCKPLDCVSTD